MTEAREYLEGEGLVARKATPAEPPEKPWHFDARKPTVHLIPPRAVIEEARVFEYGSEKYGDRNWEDYAEKWGWCDLIASTLRHILAWESGEDLDTESGLHHLAHARCDLGMLLELILTHNGTDDRSKLRAPADRP